MAVFGGIDWADATTTWRSSMARAPWSPSVGSATTRPDSPPWCSCSPTPAIPKISASPWRSRPTAACSSPACDQQGGKCSRSTRWRYRATGTGTRSRARSPTPATPWCWRTFAHRRGRHRPLPSDSPLAQAIAVVGPSTARRRMRPHECPRQAAIGDDLGVGCRSNCSAAAAARSSALSAGPCRVDAAGAKAWRPNGLFDELRHGAGHSRWRISRSRRPRGRCCAAIRPEYLPIRSSAVRQFGRQRGACCGREQRPRQRRRPPRLSANASGFAGSSRSIIAACQDSDRSRARRLAVLGPPPRLAWPTGDRLQGACAASGAQVTRASGKAITVLHRQSRIKDSPRPATSGPSPR